METIQDEENASLIYGGKSSGNDGEIETTSIFEENENPLLAFIKIPLEDRKKYEKLNSNDFITSDDSDSDFYSKRNNLINSIPDKSHIKNKIKSNRKDDVGSDVDSIGSASDLRANELVDLDEFDQNSNSAMKKHKKNKIIDDGISESIKTCNSSSYHAECESVATNEDNMNRITRKIKIRKRNDRMNDSTNTITNANLITSTDITMDPLLLDDELDYDDSGENTDNKPKEEETDDVFSLAPFKMPTLPKKNKLVKRRNILLPPPSPKTSSNIENFDLTNRMTSTPIQCNPTVHSSSNYGIVTVNTRSENSDSKDDDLFCSKRFSSSNIFEDDLNSLRIISVENNNNRQIKEFEETDNEFIKFGDPSDINQKIKKEKIKFSKLDDLTSVLPIKFSQKVKANISYKKVVPESSSTKNKNCFSNMSFEDFPSDAEVDSINLITNEKTKKTAPFEVIRNEKLLMEAEKKIGSLKRKSKP